MENIKNIDATVTIKTEMTSLMELSAKLSEISQKLDAINSRTIFDDIDLRFSGISAISSFVSAVTAVVEAFKASKSKVSEIIGEMQKSLSGVGTMIDKMKTALENTSESLGENIAKGISEGIRSGMKSVEASTKVLCENGVIKEIQTTMDIHSPSRVMKKLGGYISEGLGDGITDGTKDVKNAMGKIHDTVESAAKKTSKIKLSLGGIAAIAGVVGTLIGYFASLMAGNEELSGKMEEAWGKIKEAFSPVMDAVMNLFDAFATGGEDSCSVLDTLVGVIGAVAEFISGVITAIAGFFQEHSATISAIVTTIWSFIQCIAGKAKEIFNVVLEAISGFFEKHGESIMAGVAAVWEFIKSLLDGAIAVVTGVFDIIVGIFTGNGDKIKEGFAGIWEGIKNIFSGVGDFFSSVWSKVVSIFGKIGSAVGDAMGGAFKTVVNSILSFAENTINSFIKAINNAIGMINNIPGVSISKLKLLSIPKLESGGLVDVGQVFIARESGPELVGSFGARTAVINNSQIVDAVSKGVYTAVRSAMGSGGSYTFNISNKLDGREIGKQVIKYHNGVVKQTGCSPLTI